MLKLLVMLTIGDMVPNFEGKATDGSIVTNETIKGKWTVLFFYPKAFTPGCTDEVCNIRDNYSNLKKYDINIYGVSKDDLKTQKEFKEKYKLQYELIADEEGKIIKAFKVSGFGGFAKRKTFIINPEGKIVHVFDKVNTSKHGLEVEEVLKKLIK
ncbi:MAG: peroxiredoxin [candidate division WOR-3 bacterium]|nr:peroxiredoxin [candidate division WOR-3 bacterium]MDW8150513.1 peroxiredoxin [candidate division WOR-3 bacterium]